MSRTLSSCARGRLRERVGAADELVELVDRDLVVGADRDDLLREHVERVPRDRRLLDRPLAHRLGHDGALEQVGSELREDAALRDRAELVAGAADPLQAARHRFRALDLHDEVDRAHVDSELQARRGDEARDPSRLEVFLDQDPLLARQRAVVGARDGSTFMGTTGVRLRELVDPEREPLGEAAVVDEHDRRAVCTNELEQRRVDRRPDRTCRGLVPRGHLHAIRHHRLGQLARGRPQLSEILDGDHDLEVELLAVPRVDERDLAARACDEPPDLGERPLCRRQADPLERLLDDALEPLERDGEMRAALRTGHGVHLVQDQCLDASQHLAALRGEEQEERLGRGDEHVRRLPQHPLPVALRRVPRTNTDGELRAEPRERPAQVPLDVVVERLERRDVEEAKPFARRLVQAVDPLEEGGKRLPGAGRRLNEHVCARRDRGPAELLRRSRRREGTLEPGSRRRRQRSECVHPSSVASDPILGRYGRPYRRCLPCHATGFL